MICPVDRRGPAVLGQQRGVEVEGPQPRHGPDDLGEHTEGDHDAQVGPQRLEGLDELRGFQLFGLQYRQTQFQSRDLNLAPVYFLSASGGFVGRSHHAHNVVAAPDERPQRRHGEFGRAHEYDAKVFGVHALSFFQSQRVVHALLLGLQIVCVVGVRGDDDGHDLVDAKPVALQPGPL